MEYNVPQQRHVVEAMITEQWLQRVRKAGEVYDAAREVIASESSARLAAAKAEYDKELNLLEKDYKDALIDASQESS